jgi:hypothetical protein
MLELCDLHGEESAGLDLARHGRASLLRSVSVHRQLCTQHHRRGCTAATVAVLATLIALLAPVSQAHFTRRSPWCRPSVAHSPGETPAPTPSSKSSAAAGAILANAMFDLPWLQSSAHARTGPSHWVAEAVATFGLILDLGMQPGWSRPGSAQPTAQLAGALLAFLVARWLFQAHPATSSERAPESSVAPSLESRADHS